MSTPVTRNLLQRYKALSRKERRLFLQAILLLPLLHASLRLAGFRRTQALLGRWISADSGSLPPAEAHAQSAIAVTVRMVRAASRHTLTRATCLEGSLVLWWLLARQGISSQLRIGIRKEAEKFEAHAWVERSGAVLNDPEGLHRHYPAFDETFPREGAEAR